MVIYRIEAECQRTVRNKEDAGGRGVFGGKGQSSYFGGILMDGNQGSDSSLVVPIFHVWPKFD